MSNVDYKIHREKHLDDGTIIVTLRFYRGSVTTENEQGSDGVIKSVTRYRRSVYLGEKQMRILEGDSNRATFLKSMNVELKTVSLIQKVAVIDEQKDVSLTIDLTKVEVSDSVVKTEVIEPIKNETIKL